MQENTRRSSKHGLAWRPAALALAVLSMPAGAGAANAEDDFAMPPSTGPGFTRAFSSAPGRRTTGSSISTASRTGAIPARRSTTTMTGLSAAFWSGGNSRSAACRSGSRSTARSAICQRGRHTNRLDPEGLDETAATKFRWIATARGGVEQTLGPVTVFASGGVAAARIYNSVTDIDFGPNIPRHIDRDDSFRDSSTRIGWVIGLGVEAPLADAWTLRLEGSYLDFGRSKHYVNRSGNNRCGAEGPRRPCPYSVENKLGIVRLAIIRRFDL